MRDTETGRGKSKLPMENLMWDLIPGPWDHNLSQRQIDDQPLSHGGAPMQTFNISIIMKKK